MKSVSVVAGVAAALLTGVNGLSLPLERRDVYTNYPYTGPAVPIADWVDQSINGNGKGFIRLVEKPAVKPAGKNPTNNINTIKLSYVPGGINVHFSTPFGLGVAPSLMYGTDSGNLKKMVSGATTTYDRTPPCSLGLVTMCNQFFHDIQITGLKEGTSYYYQLQAANGTTESDIMTFTTALAAGKNEEFTVAMINDMGYINAQGTHKMLEKAVESGTAFAWHGGDISYSDDFYLGIIGCIEGIDECYNGTSSNLPPGNEDPNYKIPVPAGEIPDFGTPFGGDASVLYETNEDIWGQWMNDITSKIPYMTNPGNHEAACAEGDGPGAPLATYLNLNRTNSTSNSKLTYYSCPPSQRNFTAYQHRWRMPGAEVGGQSDFWYSFDYGLAHFISFDGETDYANSPSQSFQDDLARVHSNAPFPLENQTSVIDAGPFGRIDGGIAGVNNTKNYEQYQWLANDLANVDRTKTPWVIAMSHRPMYSSATAAYQVNMRNAFEELFISHGVDLYVSGHIHWYERMFPMSPNSVIDTSSIIDRNTYYTNEGVSMTHIVNGQAGNIETHTTMAPPFLPITNYLDQLHFGYSSMTIHNKTALTWNFVHGDGSGIGDSFTLLKRKA